MKNSVVAHDYLITEDSATYNELITKFRSQNLIITFLPLYSIHSHATPSNIIVFDHRIGSETQWKFFICHILSSIYVFLLRCGADQTKNHDNKMLSSIESEEYGVEM